jgi:hypothetical protein
MEKVINIFKTIDEKTKLYDFENALASSSYSQLAFLDSDTQIISWISDNEYNVSEQYKYLNKDDSLLEADIDLSRQMLERFDDEPHDMYKGLKKLNNTELDPAFMEFQISRDINGYKLENINKFLNFVCQSMSKNSLDMLLKFIQKSIETNTDTKISIVDKNRKFGKMRKHFNLFSIRIDKEIIKIEIQFTYLGFTLVHDDYGAIYKIFFKS